MGNRKTQLNRVVQGIRRERAMAENKVVQPIWAMEGEIVEIHWRCKDQSVFLQRVTIPPKATREVQQWAEQKVRERAQGKAIASETKAIATDTPDGPVD